MHNENYDNDYLVSLIDPRTGPHIIHNFCGYIKRSGVDFDTVVCRGTSGLLVAPQVCQKLTKHLIISRKANDGTHSMFTLEGFLGVERFIIVDDLIASGATIRAALNQMSRHRPEAKCVGIFLYRSGAVDTYFMDCGQLIPRFNQEVDTKVVGDGFKFSYCPDV